MTVRKWLTAAAFTAGFAIGSPAVAADPTAKGKEVYTFGTLRAATADQAKAAAEKWLKASGKLDAAAFEKIWAEDGKSVLDKTVATIELGNPEAAAALAEARELDAVPKAVPVSVKDAKQDSFFRANFALAYAKALSGKKVYEEALEALRAVQPEQVVDPAAYFFHKAVAEHALIQKEHATNSITRLLEDVEEKAVPDRYRMVAALMFFEMQNWAKDEKDLSNITKLMDNSGRRLDLARGGEKTQDIQKKIVFRLDELIKELENQCKGGNCNGGNCPNGGKPGNGGGANPSAPMQDSNIATNGGAGKVDEKRLKQIAETWGTLPKEERVKVMMEITKDLPPKYRQVIEEYFKSLNRLNGVQP